MSMTTPRVTVPVELADRIKAFLAQAREDRKNSGKTKQALEINAMLHGLITAPAAPAPEGGAVHYGDPCIKCGVGHENVPPGPCRGDGITISRERATAILDYLKKGSGPAGWPTTLWCEVQAFIANIEAALATREDAPADPLLALARSRQNAIEEVVRLASQEAPAEAGELAEAVERLTYAADFLEGDCVIVGDHEVRGDDLLTVLSALRAQPPAREDAQPVAWRMIGSEGGLIGMRSEPYHSGFERMMKADVGCTVQPLYIHPAPDALRVAVEALEPFAAHPDFHAGDDWPVTFVNDEERAPGVTAGDFRRARQALAALQAEQGAK